MRLDQIPFAASLIGAAAARECTPAAIQPALPPGASVNFARSVPANGTFDVPPGNIGYPASPTRLPPLCAVSIQVPSVGNSSFSFGLFLPDEWNGRFVAVGNGGFVGGINWKDMAPVSRYGFAAMSTDTGHNSTNFDGDWAADRNALENWGHLAMHGSVVTGKIATAAYYGKNSSYSYYSGCSTGGRQGLKEAEFYPDDFDGIVAGAPAWWTSHLQPWTVKVALYNLPTTADYHISPALFPIIGAEVIKQCDPQDGVVDGIVSDPMGCHFRPQELLCGAGVTNATASSCLTGPQISTLNKIYTDSIGENQTFFFPHLLPGSEAQWVLLSGNAPNPLGTDYVKYFIGLGADWDYNNYNEDIQRLADTIQPGNASVNPDRLSAYHAKGGKILTYHGMADGLIPTGSSPYLYNQLEANLKPKGIDMDSWYRFFLVPGMAHCSGTPAGVDAPWYFAGPGQAPTLGDAVYGVPGFRDEKHDALLALMKWVEESTAPDSLIGTKFKDDSTQAEVAKQRPLCMYPKEAKYKGTGDVNAAENWECKSLY